MPKLPKLAFYIAPRIQTTMSETESNKNVYLLNAVAFAILMQNGEGVEDKSPDYIMEKFRCYCEGDADEWMWGLGSINRAKLSVWAKQWGVDIPKEEDL